MCFLLFSCLRSREQLEFTKPKPADVAKPKKSNSTPPMVSPGEEPKPPPGFVGQPPSSTVLETTPRAILSNNQGPDFSQYGGVADLPAALPLSALPLPSVSDTIRLPMNIEQPRSDFSTLANPPPGFSRHTETEWPDLTADSWTDSSRLPPGIPGHAGWGNISKAVMNTNQQLNLLPESQFPSLGSEPTSTPSTHSWPNVSPSPHPKQSKLLQLAMAATSSDGSNSGDMSLGSVPTSQAATGFDLSSQTFPPMAATPVVVGGSGTHVSGNQNNNVPSEDSSSTSESSKTKKSKQSQVIEKVRKALSYDKDKFTEFKTLMGWYKNGEIGIGDYKTQCLQLFGHKWWKEIGPELAEVMPTHEKKNELLSSFGARSAGGGKKSTIASKSRKQGPVTVPSVWGTGPVVPVHSVHNFNTMATELSDEEYPTLGSAVNLPKPLPSTSWNNMVVQ